MAGLTKAEKKWVEDKSPCIAFKLNASDFTEKNQKMIRHMYADKMLFLTEAEVGDIFKGEGMNVNKINEKIEKLKTEIGKRNFEFLFKTVYKGMGPGEVLLYLILDKITLAGGSKSGDIKLNNKIYEIKAGKPSEARPWARTGIYGDFTMGKTKVDDIIIELKDLAKKYGLGDIRTTFSIPDKIREKSKMLRDNKFAEIEKKYQERVSEYMKEHPVLILENNASKGKYGEILLMVNDASRVRIIRQNRPGSIEAGIVV